MNEQHESDLEFKVIIQTKEGRQYDTVINETEVKSIKERLRDLDIRSRFLSVGDEFVIALSEIVAVAFIEVEKLKELAKKQEARGKIITPK